MAKRRKVGNLLALAVLTSLVERPMHPYEMASEMRERGKDQSIKINWGSLYTVVQNLEKHGLIAAAGTSRQGRHPERTIYEITPGGPRRARPTGSRSCSPCRSASTPAFEAALSLMGILPPERVVAPAAPAGPHPRGDGRRRRGGPRPSWSRACRGVFVVEAEYRVALAKAELDWIRSLLDDIEKGTLDGLEDWRKYHEEHVTRRGCGNTHAGS